MDIGFTLFRFLIGLALGSFLNVIALRYRPDQFLFARGTWTGRSMCPFCHRQLRWFELIPLLSFVFQSGKCRRCEAVLSWQYPLVELISGLIFAFAPLAVAGNFPFIAAMYPYVFVGTWVVALYALFLVALIDARLKIIPDELNVAVAILGLVIVAFIAFLSEPVGASFLGSLSGLFGLWSNAWLEHLVSALSLSLFFFALFFFSGGRGMGMGDVKLGFALGLLFGLPDVALVVILAFIIGAIVGIVMLATGRKGRKSALPFGPFLAGGALLVVFFGEAIMSAYLGLIGF